MPFTAVNVNDLLAARMRELLLLVVVVRFIVGPGLTYTLCGYLTLPPTAAAYIRLLHANSRYGGLRDLLIRTVFFSLLFFTI